MTQQTITQKQQKIITLIPRFRFLNRTHIQSFLNHKDKRRINSWLKDLTKKEYIKRIYDDGIIGKNRKPAVFFMDNTGIAWIKERELYPSLIHRLYWDKKRSETFINHCLMIATISCELEKKNSSILHYEYVTGSDYSDIDNPFHFLKDSALPVDLCFSKKQKGKKIRFYLLTIFDATLPRYRLRKRVRDSKEFYYGNDWENNIDTPFPTLLFVFQTKERMIYAKRYAKTLFDDDKPDDLSINFAIADDVRINGVTGKVWEKVE